MSRYCDLSGKGPLTGNTRSHSLRATRRRWNVNLHKISVLDENGRKVTIKVSARTLRTLKKYQQQAHEHCNCGHCNHQEEVAA